MSETIDKTIPKGKIYKDRAFWVGTFLGGPLVAGYLFSENFKSLGQPEKVKPTWIITIIATVVIFGGIFMIPENINIPNQIIPIAYTAIAFGLFKKYQEEKAAGHIEQGGLIYGWGKVIGVAIIGLLITIVPIFTFACLSDSIEQANISTKTYGVSVKHEIDFDESNISEVEVDRIAEGFRETGFFDLSVAKYVYVVKNGSKYYETSPVFPRRVEIIQSGFEKPQLSSRKNPNWILAKDPGAHGGSRDPYLRAGF